MEKEDRRKEGKIAVVTLSYLLCFSSIPFGQYVCYANFSSFFIMQCFPHNNHHHSSSSYHCSPCHIGPLPFIPVFASFSSLPFSSLPPLCPVKLPIPFHIRKKYIVMGWVWRICMLEYSTIFDLLDCNWGLLPQSYFPLVPAECTSCQCRISPAFCKACCDSGPVRSTSVKACTILPIPLQGVLHVRTGMRYNRMGEGKWGVMGSTN